MNMNIANMKSSRKLLAVLFVAMLALVCVAGAATLYEKYTEVNAADDILHVSGKISADTTYNGKVQIDTGATLTVPADITITVAKDCVLTVYGTLKIEDSQSESGLVIVGDGEVRTANGGKIAYTSYSVGVSAKKSSSSVASSGMASGTYISVSTSGPVVSPEVPGIHMTAVNTNTDPDSNSLPSGSVTTTGSVFLSKNMSLGSSASIIISDGGLSAIPYLLEDETLYTTISSSGKVTVMSGTLSCDLALSGNGYLDGRSGCVLNGSVSYIDEDSSGVMAQIAFSGVGTTADTSVRYVAGDNPALSISGGMKGGSAYSSLTLAGLIYISGEVTVGEHLIMYHAAGYLMVYPDSVLTFSDFEDGRDNSFISYGTVKVYGDVRVMGDTAISLEDVEVPSGMISSVVEIDADSFDATMYSKTEDGTRTYFYTNLEDALEGILDADGKEAELLNSMTLDTGVMTLPSGAKLRGNVTLTLVKSAVLVLDPGSSNYSRIICEATYSDSGSSVYAGLQGALSEAPEGATVATASSCELSGVSEVRSGVSLEIRAHELTITESGSLMVRGTVTAGTHSTITVEGSLGVSGGLVDAGGGHLSAGESSSVSVDSGMLTLTGSEIVAQEGAELRYVHAQADQLNVYAGLVDSLSVDGADTVTVHGSVGSSETVEVPQGKVVKVTSGAVLSAVLRFAEGGDAPGHLEVLSRGALACDVELVPEAYAMLEAGASATGSLFYGDSVLEFDTAVFGSVSAVYAMDLTVEDAVRPCLVLSGSLSYGSIASQGVVSASQFTLEGFASGEVLVPASFTVESGILASASSGDLTVGSGGPAVLSVGVPGGDISSPTSFLVGPVTVTSSLGTLIVSASGDVSKAVMGPLNSTSLHIAAGSSTVFLMTQYASGSQTQLYLPDSLDIPDIELDGWYTQASGGTEVSSAKVGQYTDLYGQVEVSSYTVNFTAAEGTEYWLDGSKVSGANVLGAGAHELRIVVLDGYRGAPVVSVTGGLDYNPNTYTMTLSGQGGNVNVSGVTVMSSDGLTLMDVILIVIAVLLLVLVALLAVYVLRRRP